MNKWFSIESEDKLSCCNCGDVFPKNIGGLDHHPSICTKCGIECVLFEWSKLVQIHTQAAPSPIRRFILWAQHELDELEFIELLSSFEELGEEISNKS
ncbi:hypothetical protein [Pleionea sp. CnH1-48]|uniref:hypothetical protein n=1 Tax=Pleionea sp. CnH1-48 TaxID=2954494 RepID=UPI0020973296|nr:hypothetical protein [Pleionea sp. CnH1-48]MCO7224810.1 hypothetical protein [Pleionea sp. CnH1-48]